MTTDEKKDLIVQLVEDVHGCKGVELAVKYITACLKPHDGSKVDLGDLQTDEPLPDKDGFVDDDGDEFVRLVDELVSEEKLIEIDYISINASDVDLTLYDHAARIRSFLLPGRTQIKISSNWAKNLYSVDGEYREVIRMVRD